MEFQRHATKPFIDAQPFPEFNRSTMPAHPVQALLLLGPTGSGKTPLGNWLETHGLHGRPCYHFDFGANLRAAAERGPSELFAPHEIDFLRNVLERGALLENESFYLAEKILNNLISARMAVAQSPLLVLNGLPRHLGQAQALAKIVHISHVLQLECEPQVILERLRLDSGGDRHGRVDDNADLVARKLQIYRERTQPLVNYYQAQGARNISVPVNVNTQPDKVATLLAQKIFWD